jgi:nitric oxide reductase NorQ protein
MTQTAILKPMKAVVNGKNKMWLEDFNGAKYKVLEDPAMKQRMNNAMVRDALMEVTLVDGTLTYTSRARNKVNFVQFKDFPELNALRESGPNPDVDAKPNPIKDAIRGSLSLKPEVLELEDLKWKTLMHDVLTAKNIMMVGPSGTGKTFVAQCMAKAFENARPYYYFNLGASQDPRTFLIGNTQFNKDDGTYFNRSAFINAIQTENSIILLDEISRAHPDAWNILMTVLDQAQRYVRIDEADGTPVIHVAKGVSFIATANIGNEYTATRVMDHALIERFELMEMVPLSKEGEVKVMTRAFPYLEANVISSIASIAETTRMMVANPDEDKISKILSTRSTLAIAEMCNNGFTLAEAAEVRIYPYFDNEGGVDSERTFMKQLVQKYLVTETTKTDTTEMFNADIDLLDEKPWN